MPHGQVTHPLCIGPCQTCRVY
ncbi:hypothetical protein F383_27841 [Gossypium arboreum]|uniref:Uncharacterized protein n=1 Tax=Gossypium arboreum TaxID=29729 RepID=A0A0B0MU05_GOSAR|nr:hypothetical protein F383_27841 [Gossypium arboreum]